MEFFGVEVAPSTASNSEISKITISPGENFIHTNKSEWFCLIYMTFDLDFLIKCLNDAEFYSY